MFKKYSLKQNIIVFGIILLVVILTSFPYLIGYFVAGTQHFFAYSSITPADYNVYYSYIEQVREGHYLVANLFTSEAQNYIYFTPVWLVLGVIARIFSLSSSFVFHLARIATTVLMLYFLFYYFLDIFCKKFFDKVVAFLLICFSGGVGILSFKYFPVDLFIPESNTFTALFHSSLYILAQLFVLVVFYIFLKKKQTKPDYIYIFLVSLFLGFIHPYESIIILAVLLVYFVFSSIFKQRTLVGNMRKYLIKYLIFIFGLVPFLYYYFFILAKEPAIWGWLEQNVTWSYPPISYLLAYIFLIPLSLLSLYFLNNKNKPLYFLLIWIATIFLLIYFPVSFQKRLISTAHIALAILASYSLVFLLKRWLKMNRLNFINLLIALTLLFFISFSNIFHIYINIYNYVSLVDHFYFPADYYQAGQWLRENETASGAILAQEFNSLVLPVITVKPVYSAHSHQTLNYWQKKFLLNNWFFKDNNENQEKSEFLRNNNINYIFYTEREKNLGEWNLDQADFLENIYQNESVIIYKVK